MDISNYNIEQCDAVSVLNAIMDMHDHPQKIDQIAAAVSPIAAAAAAYSEGKPQLAQAITAKGVTTAADASLATMARNVGAIVQSTTILQGGEMYAKQLFGALEAPCFWNLYDVLANIMSYNTNSFSGSPYTALQGHQFGGIMLFEFPKGDATTSLSDFPLTGGGYIMSDGAAYYNEAPTHTWNDDLDGKGNRWIALLMATEGENFTIASAAVCPLSIYIGGKVGTITYGGTSAGKIREIVVPDGNELGDLALGTSYAQNWDNNLTVKNIASHSSGALLNAATDNIYLQVKAIGTPGGQLVRGSANGVIVELPEEINIPTGSGRESNRILYGINPKFCIIRGLKKIRGLGIASDCSANVGGTLVFADLEDFGCGNGDMIRSVACFKKMYFPVLETASEAGNYAGYGHFEIVTNLAYMYIGYKGATCDSSKSVKLLRRNMGLQQLTDIELKDGYKKNLNIASLSAPLTAENIALHMLDRLATNDTGGTLTLKLGSTNLATIQNDATYSSYLTAAATKGWSVIA